MIVQKLADMKGGWFVGDFLPTAYPTKGFEVSFKAHKEGENWPTHYHERATEINLLVRGNMSIQDRSLSAGDIFTLAPYEIADPVFHTDCEVVCVKVPSVPDDKVVVERKSGWKS